MMRRREIRYKTYILYSSPHLGNTSVLSAVNGPSEAKSRSENAFQANLEIQIHPLSGQSGVQERYQEKFLRDAASLVLDLAAYPRTNILVTVQVVNDNGSLLSAMWNSVMFALLDACVRVRSSPVWAVSLTLDPVTETVKVDDGDRDDDGDQVMMKIDGNRRIVKKTHLTLVGGEAVESILAMDCVGRIPKNLDLLEECMAQGLKATRLIHSFAQSCLVSKLQSDFRVNQ